MAGHRTYLGVDLGTSGMRCLLIDGHGAALGSAEASYAVSRPHEGWNEQNPHDWICAMITCCARLRADHEQEFAAVGGIGVAGHMHGATVVDEAGDVLRPCILWNDTRSHQEAASLNATRMQEISSNTVFPGFTAPKLAWLAQHEPAIFARIDKVLLPAAYLNFWLTGEAACDYSDASGTSWLNVNACAWSQEALGLTQLTPDHMPRLVSGDEVIGTLSKKAANALGLQGTVHVVGGAGDNAAAACGGGIIKEGQGLVSVGTSGVLLVARERFHPNAKAALHSFCHALADRWIQMGVILSATDSLNWLAKTVGRSPADLTQAVAPNLTPPSSVQFYPYLSGERTPLNDAHIRGCFIGLDHQSDAQTLTKAVLEGVCFALRDSLEIIKQAGSCPNDLLAIGGGSKSSLWLKTLATILNTPLRHPQEGEFGAALGAARLALLGVENTYGAHLSAQEVMSPPATASIIEPCADLVPVFEERYAHFSAAAPILRQLQGL